jgi:hypothetical protein
MVSPARSENLKLNKWGQLEYYNADGFNNNVPSVPTRNYPPPFPFGLSIVQDPKFMKPEGFHKDVTTVDIRPGAIKGTQKFVENYHKPLANRKQHEA